jgi:transcriptional regulator with XRE-family HTH domain
MRDMEARKRRKEADDLLAPYIGPRLLRLRKGQRITQEKLAKRVGIDPSTLGRIESGKVRIKPDVMASLCTALGASVDEVLTSAAEDLKNDYKKKRSGEIVQPLPAKEEPLRALEDKIREKHDEHVRSERELLEAAFQWVRYVLAAGKLNNS